MANAKLQKSITSGFSVTDAVGSTFILEPVRVKTFDAKGNVNGHATEKQWAVEVRFAVRDDLGAELEVWPHERKDVPADFRWDTAPQEFRDEAWAAYKADRGYEEVAEVAEMVFARALPPMDAEPPTKTDLVAIEDEPTGLTTTRKLAYAGAGLGLLASLAALLWYLGVF